MAEGFFAGVSWQKKKERERETDLLILLRRQMNFDRDQKAAASDCWVTPLSSCIMRDLRLATRCKWDLRSSGMLRAKIGSCWQFGTTLSVPSSRVKQSKKSSSIGVLSRRLTDRSFGNNSSRNLVWKLLDQGSQPRWPGAAWDSPLYFMRPSHWFVGFIECDHCCREGFF